MKLDFAWFMIAIIFVVVVIIITLSLIRDKRRNAFTNYIKKNFPDIPKGHGMLMAHQETKVNLYLSFFDIALIIYELKKEKELILFILSKEKEIIHEVYSFKDLTAIHSSDRIVQTSKVPPHTYNHERTMAIEFSNGSKYNFIGIEQTNKDGTDVGSEDLKNYFAPYEEKLKKIIE